MKLKNCLFSVRKSSQFLFSCLILLLLLVLFVIGCFFNKFIFYTFCIHFSLSLIEHIRPKNIQIKAKPNSSNSFYFSVPLLDVVVFLLLLLLWCECRTNELREKKNLRVYEFFEPLKWIRHMLNSKIPNWQEENSRTVTKKVRMHAKCLSTPDFSETNIDFCVSGTKNYPFFRFFRDRN